MLFQDLNIIMPIQRALQAEKYEKPTPIQEKAIPPLIAGRDLLGCAQTGTGKTAAFAIPILQRLFVGYKKKEDRPIRALVLAPTRELAVQIGQSFKTYGQFMKFKTLVIYGGISQDYQVHGLSRGVEILVATPGRLLDLIQQGHVKIDQVEMFVLDEADRMLDMGMIHDVKKIISFLPEKRQSMLFSATMPKGVMQLVDSILVDPVKIETEQPSSTVKKVKQMVYFVDGGKKTDLLIHLLNNKSIVSALVFTRTKQRVDKVNKALHDAGFSTQALHGDKSQYARQKALDGFKNKEFRVLVATDVAARGIDVEELTHVFNYDLPDVAETYVHRVGRTARAGLSGTAITLCSNQEKPLLKAIEALIGKTIDVVMDHPYLLDHIRLEQNIAKAKKEFADEAVKMAQKSNSYKGNKKPNNNSNQKSSTGGGGKYSGQKSYSQGDGKKSGQKPSFQYEGKKSGQKPAFKDDDRKTNPKPAFKADDKKASQTPYYKGEGKKSTNQKTYQKSNNKSSYKK